MRQWCSPARTAARRGAAVVLAGPDGHGLRSLADLIRAAGGRAALVVADVAVEPEAGWVARTALDTFGRFDTWVNTISGPGDQPADGPRAFDAAFWGVVNGSREAVRHYRHRGDGGGAVVTVDSLAGYRPGAPPPSCAAFAVRGYTDALRRELAAEGLPVAVTLVHADRAGGAYDRPDAVAEAVLDAAAHPRADVHVGRATVPAPADRGGAAHTLTDAVTRRYLSLLGLARHRVATGSG